MPATEIRIGNIILAAGASTRLGEPKQLLRFRGKTLIRRAVETALKIGAEKTIVVTGANSEKIEKEINYLDCQIVYNENWQSGMGSSIKIGIETLLAEAPETAAVIISLSDQPLIESDHFVELIEEFKKSEKEIVSSVYSDNAGVPALFSRKYFSSLVSIEGDRGAKYLINQNIDDTAQVVFSQNSIDIDTLADYKKLLLIDSENS